MADADDKTKAKRQALSDDELAQQLEQMNRAAIGHLSDEVSGEQDDNLERYLGMPYGDEEEGRSQAISMDVAETVDWAVPDVLEPFISGDRVVEFVPSSKAEQEYCDRATDLVDHDFWNECDGVMFLHDVVKTGAIQKIGFSKTVWEEREVENRETMTGLSLAHLQELQADKSITIEEQSSEPIDEQLIDPAAQQAFSDGQVYTVTVTKTTKTGCNKLMALPPEQVKFSARTADIKEIDYICHETETTRSKLLEMGFDEDDVNAIPSAGNRGTDETRDEIRFHDESRRDNPATQRANEVLLLCEEYPLIDADGDGRLERLQVFRVGKTILKKEEVEEHPFDAWSPDRIPHRLVGLALADKVKQTAYIKTHLTRQMLDNVYLANNPRIEVPDGAMGDDTIADLLTYRVGGLIRTKGQGQMLRPIEIPDRSATALSAITYMDGVREMQSGITRNGMAVSSEEVDPKSATESRRQDRNEQVRKRLMCRMLAETFLVPVFRKMLKNCVRYQNASKEILVRGKWVMVDPRGWNANLRCKVSVGLGHANRDEMIQAATVIGQAQQLAQPLGIIQPKHAYNLISKLVLATGLQFPEDYALDPTSPEGQKVMQQMAQSQQQDPKMVEAQGKLQIKQGEAQAKQQLAQGQAQVQAQLKMQDIAHQNQIAQLKADADYRIAQMQAEMEFRLGQAKIASEHQLSQEQMQAEQDLAEWEARENIRVKEKAITAKGANGSNGSTSSGVRFGGKVG
jgi:hypothetical protein